MSLIKSEAPISFSFMEVEDCGTPDYSCPLYIAVQIEMLFPLDMQKVGQCLMGDNPYKCMCPY